MIIRDVMPAFELYQPTQLRDAFALEVTSENQRDHAGLLVLDLEHAVDVIVAVRTRVSQERVRFLHRVVECLRALQSSGPAQHLAQQGANEKITFGEP